ncbi:MAG: hypothetical protein JRN56_03315 [Nitrososphaerota archaeon]|jgi:hypothetical protein|nr:hypothetical protein [Nitrososphaerota archaeon]MDG6903753.1 hypothetical protein [Nitrososphaerota archaeon]MDG6911614.1 hypothetical protein [Nitrososphaerota archaeon]MDG6940518.1 hypothetical protein [Nitrososphaerota archaeon]MDG6960829.1 hypothetical protein [Nitrososphaerota archaeon]
MGTLQHPPLKRAGTSASSPTGPVRLEKRENRRLKTTSTMFSEKSVASTSEKMNGP